jgi:hypothetical protein
MNALALALPRRSRGRQSDAAKVRYQEQIEDFCDQILEIRSRLDFEVSARGWAYILEEHGLSKGDFDAAEELICDCRKSGALPLDICAEDGARAAENVQRISSLTPEGEAKSIVSTIRWLPDYYTPVAFWEDQDCYLEMLVEKVDLKSLFGRICGRFHIPITNARGWTDLNSRAAMMRRFARWEAKGKRCVLVYCGDHDPSGLVISTFIRSNMAELATAVGWSPDNLIIDRFGLNFDFHQGAGAHLDRRAPDRQQQEPRGQESPRPLQDLRPGLPPPIRCSEGGGERPRGPPGRGSPALPRRHPPLRARRCA